MTSGPEPEQLQPRVLHNRAIQLAEPDPRWATQFTDVEAGIRAAVGQGALVVEHVGSTSIPGLVAKPILDVLLLVADSADESGYVSALEGAGYVFIVREPGQDPHRLFKRASPDVNLHVYTVGSLEAEKLLRFRDWLRRSPEDRELYARAKKDLAVRQWEYVQDYADAKATVVEDILTRAH